MGPTDRAIPAAGTTALGTAGAGGFDAGRLDSLVVGCNEEEADGLAAEILRVAPRAVAIAGSTATFREEGEAG